jgi:hypothetical protein
MVARRRSPRCPPVAVYLPAAGLSPCVPPAMGRTAESSDHWQPSRPGDDLKAARAEHLRSGHDRRRRPGTPRRTTPQIARRRLPQSCRSGGSVWLTDQAIPSTPIAAAITTRNSGPERTPNYSPVRDDESSAPTTQRMTPCRRSAGSRTILTVEGLDTQPHRRPGRHWLTRCGLQSTTSSGPVYRQPPLLAADHECRHSRDAIIRTRDQPGALCEAKPIRSTHGRAARRASSTVSRAVSASEPASPITRPIEVPEFIGCAALPELGFTVDALTRRSRLTPIRRES